MIETGRIDPMNDWRRQALTAVAIALGTIVGGGCAAASDGQPPLLAEQSGVWGSFFLVDQGLAYSWGYRVGSPNQVSRQFPGLGQDNLTMGPLPGPFQNLPFPIQFFSATNQWIAASCNDTYAFLLSESGDIWVIPFKPNVEFQSICSPLKLPQPDGVAGWKSIATSGFNGYLISLDGGLYKMSRDWTNTPSRFPEGATRANWLSVKTSDLCSLAIDTEGRLFGWGFNISYGPLGPNVTGGQLNQPTLLHSPPNGGRWNAVRLSNWHAAGLTEDGRLFTWGTNSRGQLGSSVPYGSQIFESLMPEGVHRWLDAWCGVDFTLAMGDNGNLYEWGSGVYTADGLPEVRRYPPPPNSGGWVQATVGEYHRMALTGDGRLFAWGSNFAGQLGRGRSGTGQLKYNYFNQYDSTAEYQLIEAKLPTVGAGNRAPSARLLAPLHGSEYGHPHPLQLVAQAVDPEGALARVEFVIDGSPTLPAHLDTNGLYVADWPDPPQGEYAIKVHAVDALGAEGWSEDNWLAILPYVSIEPGHAVGREPGYNDPGEPISFIIRRTGSTDQPLEVDLTADLNSSTATPNADVVWPDQPYQSVAVIIPAGSSFIEFPVTIKPDRIAEPDETFDVCVTYARAAPASNVCASVTIRDTPDDPRRLNIPPTITLGLPGDGAEFIRTSVIPLLCTYNDSDGVVTGLDWYSGTNLLTPDGGVGTWFDWNDPSPGVYQLRARATDNEGGMTWSSTMTIAILDRTNSAQPTVVSFTTLDPIAIRGTDDSAAIKIVRSGDSYGQLTIRHRATGGVGGLDFDAGGDWVNFLSGQVAGVFRVRGLANGQAPAVQPVEFSVAGPPPGYGGFYEPSGNESSPTTIVYLTQPPGVGNQVFTNMPAPIVFDLRPESPSLAWLSVFSNPGSAIRLESSEDGRHWEPFLQIDQSTGVDNLPLANWRASLMMLFRAAAAR